MRRDSLLRNLPLPGHGVGPKQLEDVEGIQVEMVSEQVDLNLLLDAGRLCLDVDVTFSFRNHAAEDVTMGVSYPIGAKNNVTSFSCETDGVVHEPTLRKQEEKWGQPQSPTMIEVWFYDWTATFPADEFCMHKVKYRLALGGATRTGYTVSTGGPWKGSISKSVITLSGTPEAWSFVRDLGPFDTAEESTDRLVWCYSKYDPTPAHDVWISYSSRTLDAECASLVNKERFLWNDKSRVIALRSKAYFSAGRLSLSESQLAELRPLLLDLVSEAKHKGTDIVLPAYEKRMVRPDPE